MKKGTLKLLTVTLTIMMIISMMASTVLALDPSNLTGNTSKVTNGVEQIGEIGNTIIGVLQTIGVVLSVVILIVIGIKYMMGSAEEKAEYKKTMIPYIVGAVFIFAASVLANMIYGFVTGW